MATRDSKDPLPRADNIQRKDGGNTAVTGEGHNAGKAERVSADARYSLRKAAGAHGSERQRGGNIPATGEDHDQGKAERISADRRY